jgi:hypothetical protein
VASVALIVTVGNGAGGGASAMVTVAAFDAPT